MDMTASIAPRSDQLNAEDLLSGPRTVTITDVHQGASTEQPVDIVTAEFGTGRPWKPSKTVRRILVAAWGPEASTYVGRRATIYRDPDVKFGGMAVGGIRVSHLSHIDRPLTVALTVTRGKRAPFVVKPLTEPAPAPAAAPTPTPDDIAACDDQDLLRRWWIALPDRPDLRDLIQARVTEVRADTTRAATIAAEATAGARDTLPVEGGAS